MEMSDIFCPLTDADWWDAVADKFLSVLRQHRRDRICLLYNADADGFTASYFVLGIIDSLTRPQPANVQTRAVWNYEYDFSWLPDFVADNNPAVIISVDINTHLRPSHSARAPRPDTTPLLCKFTPPRSKRCRLPRKFLRRRPRLQRRCCSPR